MTTKDGGPAFPKALDSYIPAHDGMSLRDYFAAQALAGWMSDSNVGFDSDAALVAKHCYRFADAMLVAREK